MYVIDKIRASHSTFQYPILFITFSAFQYFVFGFTYSQPKYINQDSNFYIVLVTNC